MPFLSPSARALTLLITLVACGGGSNSSSNHTPGQPTARGALHGPARPDGPVVATVGSGFVTVDEFVESAARAPGARPDMDLAERKEILERLIDEEALFQEALTRGYERDPKVRKILVNMLLREEVYAKVDVSEFTEEEVRGYYDAHKSEFDSPDKRDVKRIFVRFGSERPRADAEALAKQIYTELVEDPTKFAALASKHSEDPYKRRGGDIGYIDPDGRPGIPPEVTEVAFQLDVGKISPPFEADNGFNVVTVSALRPAEQRSFDQMKGTVVRKMRSDKFQELTAKYVTKTRGAVAATIDETALGAAVIEARAAPEGFPMGSPLDGPLQVPRGGLKVRDPLELHRRGIDP